jgi:glycosyltransferase involved in cell wall biosynthesis
MMNYDIIHVHHPDPMTALALKLSGYKGKVVIHWHSDILNQRFLLRFYQPLQTWLINRADTIIATSLVYAKNSTAISKYMDKVTIVPIGIQEPIHNMSKVDIWKQKYAGKKIIFSLGRLVSYKGFKYLIKASKYLPNDYVCLIGGTGPLKKELEKEINDLHVETKTVLLGRVEEDDLCALYEACELFCLPSISKAEAFGVVLIEAMSYSKPIVTSNIIGSGVPWVNVQGKTGFNVTPQNSRDLALAIQKICENPSIKSVFGTNSRIRFETLFRKNTMVEKIYDVYRRLVPND